MDQITGNCLCQSISFTIFPPIVNMVNCHCSMCRKSSGSAFITWLSISFDNFKLDTNQDTLCYYQSSSDITRSFCKKCGSCLFWQSKNTNMAWIAAGTLNEDPQFKPTAHIFSKSKAPWFTITDHLPQ